MPSSKSGLEETKTILIGQGEGVVEYEGAFAQALEPLRTVVAQANWTEVEVPADKVLANVVPWSDFAEEVVSTDNDDLIDTLVACTVDVCSRLTNGLHGDLKRAHRQDCSAFPLSSLGSRVYWLAYIVHGAARESKGIKRGDFTQYRPPRQGTRAPSAAVLRNRLYAASFSGLVGPRRPQPA